MSAKQLNGEITMKRWLIEESARENVSPSAIAQRLSRGHYPDLRLRRVNQRVIYVRATV
jgi:hypothetical protein